MWMHCSWTLNNLLRISAGEPNWEGRVSGSTLARSSGTSSCQLIYDSASPPQDNSHAVLGAKCEGRVRHDRMIRYEVHLVLLNNHRQHQLGFNHGELAADAYPRSTAEGEVGEARAGGG